jgi:hypothetical protein
MKSRMRSRMRLDSTSGALCGVGMIDRERSGQDALTPLPRGAAARKRDCKNVDC